MPHNRPNNVGFISLGCPKALVDSERILTQLRSEGYQVVGDYAAADLVIVNTCGFIDSAIQESLDTIGEAIAENGNVIVTGCLGVHEARIMQQHPKVLAVSGPHDYQSVMNAVHQHLPARHDPFTDLLPPQGVKLTPAHYAYVKIAEGCNQKCSFCIIPSMRGKLVSRPLGDIFQEAQHLANAGVKELLIVSQDTGAYGVDLKYRKEIWQAQTWATRIEELARGLGELGIWIRMHYLYPYPHIDRLIPLMQSGAILPYLDMPLQHASPSVLKAMRRPANSENMLQRLNQWREICPELTIRSTFIVGFPGETEADFEQLLAFLEQAELDRVGCFTYSAVDGAAANQLAKPVAPELMQTRLEQVMALQANISARKLRSKIDRVYTVLVDEIDEQGAIARSSADAPEIDGLVFIEDGQQLQPGDFVDVKIVDSSDHDLYATICKSN